MKPAKELVWSWKDGKLNFVRLWLDPACIGSRAKWTRFRYCEMARAGASVAGSRRVRRRAAAQ